MADVTFIVHKEWLDAIKDLPIDQQDKIIAELVRYGVEVPFAHEEDSNVQAFINLLRGRIDFSKDRYAARVTGGNIGGARKKYDDKIIWELAHENPDWSSSQIAKILQISASTVNHSHGWKSRKEAVYVD